MAAAVCRVPNRDGFIRRRLGRRKTASGKRGNRGEDESFSSFPLWAIRDPARGTCGAPLSLFLSV